MNCYAGIDVSLESSSVCVVDAAGKIVREGKVASEPEALIGFFRSLTCELTRIGLEAGPLSQWLLREMRQASLTVELLETPHVQHALATASVILRQAQDRLPGCTGNCAADADGMV